MEDFPNTIKIDIFASYYDNSITNTMPINEVSKNKGM